MNKKYQKWLVIAIVGSLLAVAGAMFFSEKMEHPTAFKRTLCFTGAGMAILLLFAKTVVVKNSD